MRFLLDTNVISEAQKKRPNPKCANWLQAHAGASALPSLAVAERYQGAFHLAEPERARMLAELDQIVREAGAAILPFDTAAAAAWGEYVNQPEVRNKPPGVIDSMIAAMAIANDLSVVTRDVQHFPGVDVVNPFE